MSCMSALSWRRFSWRRFSGLRRTRSAQRAEPLEQRMRRGRRRNPRRPPRRRASPRAPRARRRWPRNSVCSPAWTMSHSQAVAWRLRRASNSPLRLAAPAERLDVRPRTPRAVAAQRAEPHHPRLPALAAVAPRPCRPNRRSALVICACARVAAAGSRSALLIDDEIGELHHALLDRLQVVAGVRQLQQHEHVGHAGDRGLALADADRLDDDDVVAGRLARRGSSRGCVPPRRRACPTPGSAG